MAETQHQVGTRDEAVAAAKRATAGWVAGLGGLGSRVEAEVDADDQDFLQDGPLLHRVHGRELLIGLAAHASMPDLRDRLIREVLRTAAPMALVDDLRTFLRSLHATF